MEAKLIQIKKSVLYDTTSRAEGMLYDIAYMARCALYDMAANAAGMLYDISYMAGCVLYYIVV